MMSGFVGGGRRVHTTMSSDLSLYGSLSRPSGLSRSPLMKVPLELLTSLMKICPPTRQHTHTPQRQASTDLARLLPDLRMLATHYLGVEIAVVLRRDGPAIGLASDVDALVVGEVDVLDEGVGVEREEMQGREGGEHGGGREWSVQLNLLARLWI
jgi:hypothetical protein